MFWEEEEAEEEDEKEDETEDAVDEELAKKVLKAQLGHLASKMAFLRSGTDRICFKFESDALKMKDFSFSLD